MNKLQLNIPGSLVLLENKIKNLGIDISTVKLMQIMPKYILNLDLLERSIFTSYYWRKMSIIEMSKQYNKTVDEIGQILDNGTNVFIQELYNHLSVIV